MTDISSNLSRVNERISAAATRVGRDPEEITLVTVTKAFSPQTIEEALTTGLREFGENRVQEATPKIEWFRERDIHLKWHMVGHLQRNKVKKAIHLFDVVHSVDSVGLAREISRRCETAEMTMPILLEVNVSGEASKYGFQVKEAKDEPEERFFRAVQEIATLPSLDLQGLMTMAPFGAPEEEVRYCFRRLNSILGELQEKFPENGWRHLSMGMTDDFDVAIEEGATIVRIGRAILGERKE
jgi:pyridoxal phosphate enzyme (YggS family)